MVVVLIIGILLAIGIPTFVGARGRGQDIAAESSIRTAETTARLLFDDQNSFLLAVSELRNAEPGLTWTSGASTGPDVVSVSTRTTSDGTGLSAAVASASGSCFAVSLWSNGDRVQSVTQPSTCTGAAALSTSLSVPGAAADLSGSFTLDSDGFVGVPDGSGHFYNESTAGTGSTALFTFTVTDGGDYRMIATAYAPNGTSDSFWVRTSLDAYGTTYLWDVSARTIGTDYVNNRYDGSRDVVLTIPAGSTITVEVSPREDGTFIQSMDLVPS